jgi:hypothetical protein
MFGSRDEFNSTDIDARNRQMVRMRREAMKLLDPATQAMLNNSPIRGAEGLTGINARSGFDAGGSVTDAQQTGQQQQYQNNQMNNSQAVNGYTQANADTANNQERQLTEAQQGTNGGMQQPEPGVFMNMNKPTY